MKRVTSITGIFLLALFTACSNEAVTKDEITENQSTFSINLADVLDTRGSLPEIASTTVWQSEDNIFYLASDSTEQSYNADTRMALQPDYTTIWLEKDQVNINGVGYTIVPKSPATEAEIRNVTYSSEYKGCHPNIGSFSGTTWHVDFSNTQPYGNGETFSQNAAPAVGYATTPANTIKFYNTCGILKVPVKSGTDVTINKIRFTANENISGPATVNISSTSPNMKITNGASAAKHVDILFTTAVTINPSTATNLYFVLPPNTYTGGKIEFFNGNTSKGSIRAEGNVVIERSMITHSNNVSGPLWQDTKDLIVDVKCVKSLDDVSNADEYTNLLSVYPNTIDGYANSYITVQSSTDKKYYIPATIPADAYTGTSAQSLGGYILFTVKANGNGNAVVAWPNNRATTTTSGNHEKEWSWHIWVPTVMPRTETITNKTSTTYTLLDMDLGGNIKPAAGKYSYNTGYKCTFYQWGRKDPFANATTIYRSNGRVDNVTTWPTVMRDNTNTGSSDVAGSDAYTHKRPDVFVAHRVNDATTRYAWKDDWFYDPINTSTSEHKTADRRWGNPSAANKPSNSSFYKTCNQDRKSVV